jgi:hypothetical protein
LDLGQNFLRKGIRRRAKLDSDTQIFQESLKEMKKKERKKGEPA